MEENTSLTSPVSSSPSQNQSPVSRRIDIPHQLDLLGSLIKAILIDAYRIRSKRALAVSVVQVP
jgi:hypothetical protein